MKSIRPKRPEFLAIGIGMAAISLYLLISASTYKIGFPLDDAWIHQTYARNLAVLGEWSFIPGDISGGSTSPLWSILLSWGYFLKLPVVVWPFFLGIMMLFVQAIFAGKIIKQETLDARLFVTGMIFFVLEWHFLWAALSGMETIIYSCLIIVVFFLILNNKNNYLIVGLLIGLGVWIRPDSITLMGPAVMAALAGRNGIKNSIKNISFLFLGFTLCIVPYAIFNIMISGAVWPNTFYAKQAEYSELTNIPLVIRLSRIISLPLSGAGVLLFPGFIVSLVRHIRGRNIKWIGGYLWWFGYNLIYAYQLPVTYQHGRYLIPAMGFYFIVGLIGFGRSIAWLKTKKHIFGLISKVWEISIGLVLLFFCFLGASAYGKDVAIIETEMVQVANWIHDNTSENSVIAAHDIGAIGYFSERKIIDLAGLITPDVIPIIRNEKSLEVYVIKNRADYFVTFPTWYPVLSTLWEPVYISGSKYTLDAGEENMVIYKIKH